MKFNGIDSCISNALISTNSPIVCVPAITARADSTMQAAMPAEKIKVWPKFSQASEVQVRTAARS